MATPQQTTSTVGHPGDQHLEAGFPAFRTDTYATQLVWLAIAFGGLYYLMSKIALPKVAEVLENRRERIAADLDAAAKAKQESEAAATAYEEAIASARAKAGALAKETQDRLAAESAEERKRLEAELAAKLDAAERTIAERKAQAMTNVRGIASDAASAIVERLTGRPADQKAIDTALTNAKV
ncbi:F0F1 ATP synthase subunit B' [Enterovirga rhinocerotis]|uniref:ATP synthase subunit b n=1 Tax=Enterovirga rhinocerotis TaxID=1339210 RepID=A0A4R7CAX5_9HYPH|nr:F0F1 ATP synthase subunit B' [Enterovirga rhinocerotis]TDR94555.1 F-type H+-transporting ATPase subunit b [Enterovirga rhinocerotis]